MQDCPAIKKKKPKVMLHANNMDESHRDNISKRSENKRMHNV